MPSLYPGSAVTCRQAQPEGVLSVCKPSLDLQRHLLSVSGATDMFRKLMVSEWTYTFMHEQPYL